MATKNILLAIADPQAVVGINEALGDEWLTTHVTSEADALAMLEGGSFDALLTDFNLGESDASELLNQAAEKCPNTTRFLFAYEADLALVAAKVLGEYEILPKPLEFDSLRSRIENGISDPRTSEVGTATGFDTASSIPPIYDELLQVLGTPGVTSQEVGQIIARDDTLIEETLKLTRSAYFGLPRHIVEPVEAVEALGLETVRALVLALRFLAEHSHVRPGYLSLEKIWQHSTSVAQIARDLVLFETKDRALASQALAAGLVHDLGKVVLATNFDDLYGRVHSLARKQPVALWEIETEMFGANHGEIGACLLGMWNLPPAIVEAAASHHLPPPAELGQLTPLAAVHIANVLEHQLNPNDEFRVVPVVSAPFLNQLGLLQRLPIWRATFANQRSRAELVGSGRPESVAASAQAEPASWTANNLQSPAAETQTVTASLAEEKSSRAAVAPAPAPLWRWTAAGVAAGIVLAAIMMIQLSLDSSEPVGVHARALHRSEPILAAPSLPSFEAASSAAPEEAPAMAVSEATAEGEAAPAISLEAVPEQVFAAQEVVTNIPPPAPSPVKTAPAFRLNGIFYTATNPSAIVNGETVMVGGKINGATVISISRDQVTLDIRGERKTIALPGTEAAR